MTARADLTDGQWAVLERLLHRGVATRYDKLAVRYEAGVQLAAISIWLRCLERTYESIASRSRLSISCGAA